MTNKEKLDHLFDMMNSEKLPLYELEAEFNKTSRQIQAMCRRENTYTCATREGYVYRHAPKYKTMQATCTGKYQLYMFLDEGNEQNYDEYLKFCKNNPLPEIDPFTGAPTGKKTHPTPVKRGQHFSTECNQLRREYGAGIK